MKAACATAIHRILVVCEGNHCRGPMAEALLAAALPPGFEVESAGLNALSDEPADAEARRLLAEAGLDLSEHLGRQLTPEMMLAADLILVMERSQKTWCEQMAPSARGRVFLLGHWRAADLQEIRDPFLQGPEAFREAFDGIRHSVSAWLPRLTQCMRSV